MSGQKPLIRQGGRTRQGTISMDAVTGLPEALESAAEFHDSRFVATEGQSVFTTAHTGRPLVYVNGVLLGRNLFDATDLTKITLTDICYAGDVVRVVSMAGSMSGVEGGDYYAGAGLDLTGTTFSVKYGDAAGTAAQGNDSRIVNAVPNTRTVNGKQLSGNITLTAADVGAAASSHTHTSGQVSGLGTAATKNITISTGNPTGGNNGDIWYKV